MAQSRFTIYVPQRHREGHKLPLVTSSVRNALNAAGLISRIILSSVEADLGDQIQETEIIQIDAEDDPHTVAAIKAIAEGLKSLTKHQAVYVTKSPIETWLL